MKVFVTGGLGYIGSHTIIKLLENDHDVVIYDNLSNSKLDVYNDIMIITNNQDLKVYIGDLRNMERLEDIFKKHSFDVVLHFAALKSVSESNNNPLLYYENNVIGTLNLLSIMKKYNVNKLIFSSSATVYGNCSCPCSEISPTGNNMSSVYGKTKYIMEEILKDFIDWNIVILRYFNPIGCHSSGILGENPLNTPNNLFPYILKVAKKELSVLNIFGINYDTPDGSCIRDFIHVEDLADAHILSLKKINEKGVHVYNVGTGKGYSVLEIINTFEKVNNIKITTNITDKRQGDIPILYSDSTKIQRELGWKPNKTLEDMCRDGYKYVIHKEEYIEEDFLLDETFISDLSCLSESKLETIMEEISQNYSSSSE